MSTVAVKGEIEHVIGETTRNVYMGKSNNDEKEMLTYDVETGEVKREKIKFSHGLLKIFDEIIVNAIDNLSPERKAAAKSQMTKINVTIDNYSISVENDGPCIPIRQFVPSTVPQGMTPTLAEQERMKVEESLAGEYIPTIVFTKFRSSTNYQDSSQRTTGGMNGIGAKMTCAFSQWFLIEVWESGVHFQQEVYSNCRDIQPPVITNENHPDGVKISFVPDWPVLDLTGEFTSITPEQIRLLSMRVFDFCHLPVQLSINGKALPRLNFNDFASRINPDVKFETIIDNSIGWKLAYAYVESKAKVRSYVNNVVTYSDGTHVKVIRDRMLELCQEIVKSKTINSATFRSKIEMVLYTTIPGAQFSSQSKDKLTNKKLDKCLQLKDQEFTKFVKNSGLYNDLTGKVEKKTVTKVTRTRITNISTLIEAELASMPMIRRPGKVECTLYVCEGNSAQTLCTRGIRTIGSATHGSFALRGKSLNVAKASSERQHANVELENLKKIIGLTDGTVYSDTSSLRYQHVVCAKDADTDGSAIMGLIINFFHQRFPSLLEIPGFLSELITPVVVLYRKPANPSKSEPTVYFNSPKQFEEWLRSNDLKHYSHKYVKGLGGNTDNDIDFYFAEYERHLTNLDYDDPSKERLDMVYKGTTKKYTDQRKEWITLANTNSYIDRQPGTPLLCSDFIDRDLVFAADDSCKRAIPSVIDGQKPSQRKVLYTFFNMSKTEQRTVKKIYQLTGKVADFAKYHHGDASLSETITKMCQSFVGSNNIPLLEGDGQVGTREQNGDDAAKPRYVGARLASVSRLIFPEIDDRLLTPVEEDGEKAEPIYYVPIIPVILVNGARGVGTGWSTDIPLFSPKELITITRWMINKGENLGNNLTPYFNGFHGTITQNPTKWFTNFAITKTKSRFFRLTEIPVRISVADARNLINELIEKEIVVDMKSLLTKDSDHDIDMEIEFKDDHTLEEVVQLFGSIASTFISRSNYTAYDSHGTITRFPDIASIFKEWFDVRRQYYEMRKDLILMDLYDELMVARNRKRFLEANYDLRKYDGRKAINEMLENEKYDLHDGSYEYLWGMKIVQSSKKHIDKLAKLISDLEERIAKLESTLPDQLWLEDLSNLEEAL